MGTGKNKSKKNLEEELAFLYEVMQSVYSLELNELLEEIVTIATRITHADSCFVYLVNDKKNGLVLNASKNPHKEVLSTITMRVGEGITGWVAREQRPVVIAHGAYNDSRFKLFSSLPEDSYEAFLSVPILTRGEVVGVINVQHKKEHHHTDSEINLLVAIGKLVGNTVNNARLIAATLELKEALELRKIVDKAKGIVMGTKHISEDEAYSMLRDQSMNSRKSLKEVCEAVILASAMLAIDKKT